MSLHKIISIDPKYFISGVSISLNNIHSVYATISSDTSYEFLLLARHAGYDK
jgi:hypothetical protein